MDLINIPSFAMLRYGTVILRLKMEERFTDSCREPELHRVGFPRVLHRVFSCEQCTRTRIVSQYSDCDSGLVGKCRPYRTRAAKSRYVNVCAAVCLLLLVGGLTPQSSAAPYRTRNMDRSKRAADQENETWSNPCDYNLSAINSPIEYRPELAEIVAKQAKDVSGRMKSYEQDILNLHSFTNLSDLLKEWDSHPWLRNKNNHSWWTDIVLPESKELGKPADEQDLSNTLEQINEALPLIGKTLKVLGAGFRAVSEALNSVNDRNLQANLLRSSSDMRHILCLTSDLIRARGLEMKKLLNSEIPQYDNSTSSEKAFTDAFLIYRDAINFLEYIEALFAKMSVDHQELKND